MIGNDFHTYPGRWVALFHYIALQMTDSSVINFRLDLVVPRPLLSLIIESIFLCWERLLCSGSLYSLHFYLWHLSSSRVVCWTASQSSQAHAQEKMKRKKSRKEWKSCRSVCKRSGAALLLPVKSQHTVFRSQPIVCNRGSCFANAFGFIPKRQ